MTCDTVLKGHATTHSTGNNSATKTSLAFILDANESPIQDLSFAVPFVSVLEVFFEISCVAHPVCFGSVGAVAVGRCNLV